MGGHAHTSAMESRFEDWVRLVDPKTQAVYYANSRTRKVSWEVPTELVGVATGDEEDEVPQYVKLAAGWFQYEDMVTGRFYYYNHRTRQTVWKMPAEAKPPPAAARDSAVFGSAESGDDEEEETDDGEEDEDEDEVEEVQRRSQTEMVKQAAEKRAKRAAKRLRILEEIMLTERTYVQALRTLKKVYLLPLRTVADLPAGRGQIFTHSDLDAIFVNIDLIITVNEGFLRELETELAARDGQWPAVEFGEIMKRAAKQFKGCYTRYVNNFDTAQEHLAKLKETDKEKNRYLEVCKTHPDANGLDVRSFLIQPVQRVPRYRMLLDELLAHTEDSHADEAPLREALDRVMEVAMHINEEKRALDNYEAMRVLMHKFQGCARRGAAGAPELTRRLPLLFLIPSPSHPPSPSPPLSLSHTLSSLIFPGLLPWRSGDKLEKELVSYERRLVKQGVLSKIRMTKRQQRHVFLCNDVLLYAAAPVGSSGEDAPRRLSHRPLSPLFTTLFSLFTLHPYSPPPHLYLLLG